MVNERYREYSTLMVADPEQEADEERSEIFHFFATPDCFLIFGAIILNEFVVCTIVRPGRDTGT